MNPSREMQLNEALVRRHVGRHTGGWNVGMLDIAQDHLLCHLAENGIFSEGLIFKGGTALRKCRSGIQGRFSTDLDFSAPSENLISKVFELVNGHQCHGFRFELVDVEIESGRAGLVVYPPLKENPRVTSTSIPVAEPHIAHLANSLYK